VDKTKFIKLYDEYSPRIYRFVYLKINSPQDSEDLTSEVFFKFWRSFGKEKKKEISNPKAMLYRIANNLVTDIYRKKSRTEIKLDPLESKLTKISDKTDLNSQIDLDIDMAQIKQSLTQIKPQYQDIIIWRYLDEFSTKEIAGILGKKETNIRVLTHRALKALRAKIND